MSRGHPAVLLVAFLGDKRSTAVTLNITEPTVGNVEGKTTAATTSAFFRAPAAQSQLILSPYERSMNFA